MKFYCGCVANDLIRPGSMDAVGPGFAGYYTYRAWEHAATTTSKTFGTSFLVYPAKSSIYQGFTRAAGRAGLGWSLLQVDLSLWNCVFEEWDYLNP